MMSGRGREGEATFVRLQGVEQAAAAVLLLGRREGLKMLGFDLLLGFQPGGIALGGLFVRAAGDEA